MPRTDPFTYIMPTRRPSAVVNDPTSPKSLAGRMRDLVTTPKAVVDIKLDREHRKFTYSTMDRIQGLVSITAPVDTKFDSVDINFLGQIHTFVERLGVVAAHNGRTEAFHQFLKLVQPISHSSYPEPRILQAGETYEFPFTFNVPEHLLLGACRHKVANNKIRDTHLQLPPSLGDPDPTTPGSKALNDMVPDMVRVRYGVRARVLNNRDRDGKEAVVAEAQRKLTVIPATEEQPPMTIDGRDIAFCLRKEKGIRKGMWKGKIGRLVMEAAQPRSFHLIPPSSTSSTPPSPPTTTVTVLLRFDPTDNETQPPRLGTLSNKIRVMTYYATSTMNDYPSKAAILYDYTRGHFVESVSLSSRNMASVRWHRQDPNTCTPNPFIRRDSAASTTATSTSTYPEPSSTYSQNAPFYVAEILVPITLPDDKYFAPTFHSCLASRIYILDLSLSIPSQSGSGVGSTVHLKLPVQVSSERSEDAGSSSSMSEAEQVAAYEAEVQQAVAEGDGYFFGEGRGEEPPPGDEYDDEIGFGWVGGRGSVSTQGRGSVSTQGRGSVSTQGRGSISTQGMGSPLTQARTLNPTPTPRRSSFPFHAAQHIRQHSLPNTSIFHRPPVSTVNSESSSLSLRTTMSPGDAEPGGSRGNVVVGGDGGAGGRHDDDDGPPEYSYVAPRDSVPVC